MKFITFSLKERPFNKIAIKPEDIYSVTEVAETFSEIGEILNSGDTDGR